MTAIQELVTRSLSGETTEEFLDRVAQQGESIVSRITDGEFENDDFSVGMEMEVYAVTTETHKLRHLSEEVFESGATKELGLHNAEINTDPDVLDEAGLARQAESIEQDFERACKAVRAEGGHLVLDAMWTTPPEEGSERYLCDVALTDGVTIARNMRPDPRYVALDNQALAYAGGELEFSVPGVSRTFPTILFESLATSIQPHLQIPNTEAFPAYYNVAIRTLGPVLALGTNSPFLPPDLYTDVDDPYEVIDQSHHELRIAVFEQSMNQTPNPKVCVPADIHSPEDAIGHVLEDDLYAPFLREWITDAPREGLSDAHWEYQYKRASFWRWLRCVVGGDSVSECCDERSLRIEYRPIPTQPTVRDVVGMQVLTVGLIRGLVHTAHPLAELPWEDAERAFYNAATDGLSGDLAWITADGDRTSESEIIFDDLFAQARIGLAESGVSESTIDRYLDPIERRVETGVTPSIWKKNRVREGLDSGKSFTEAITEMQAEYIERSRESEHFAEWGTLS